MRMTRAMFWAITAILWLLNGWAVLQVLGALTMSTDIVAGVLLLNMLIVPVVMWSAYRTGQLTEETFRSNAGKM